MRGYVKRYAADPEGNMRNYFNMKHTDYDDGIFFDRILNGTFTNYNEEITSRENEFDIVFGDFSIAFSLNDSIRSLNGLDVKEFFKPSDNTLYKYAISLNLGVKVIGGIMDNEETIGGNVTVNTTAVTTFSTVFLTVQNPGSNNLGFLTIQNIIPGTSFEIQSNNISDDSSVAWVLIDAK